MINKTPAALFWRSLFVSAALVPRLAYADTTNAETLRQLEALNAEVARLKARVEAAEKCAAAAQQPPPAAELLPATPSQSVNAGRAVSVDAGAPHEVASAADANPSSALPDYQYRVINSRGNALIFSGDVELNINANSNTDRGNLLFGNSDFGNGDTQRHRDRHHFGQTGRIMLEAAGTRTYDHQFASFRFQPLMDTSGSVNVDDAWFAFGDRNGWSARIGRYEAYDLFPVGADTFLAYGGDTANNLYKDGAGYSYQAKEGRGRAGSAGQMMVSRQFGELYVETSSVVGDRTELFDYGYTGRQTYHGVPIDTHRSKSTVLLRPVVAWQFAPRWRIAGGVERNIARDAIVDERGNDISARTGYATTLGYSGDDLMVNVNLAYLNALDEKDMSAGANVVYSGIGVGYIHSYNHIDWSKDVAEGSKYRTDTLYSSYQFSNVLNIDRFNLLVGSYYSLFNAQSRHDAYGVRLRFKYFL